jgi:hypothetical protein
MHHRRIPARILIACPTWHGIGIGSGWFRQQPVHQRAERRMRGGGGDGLIGQHRVAGIAREGHELAVGGAGEGAGVRH